MRVFGRPFPRDDTSYRRSGDPECEVNVVNRRHQRRMDTRVVDAVASWTVAARGDSEHVSDTAGVHLVPQGDVGPGVAEDVSGLYEGGRSSRSLLDDCNVAARQCDRLLDENRAILLERQ